MAGEYFVAAQLQRLQVNASITYGNAKSIDIIAFTTTSDYVIAIEVKTTQKKQWVVGNRVPEKSSKPWVFVYTPENPNEAPRFFIITQNQLNEILRPIELKYEENFKNKHGVDYGNRRGIVNIDRNLLASFENKWETITHQIKT